MSENRQHDDDYPVDDDGKINYHKWIQVNNFVKKLNAMHYMAQQEDYIRTQKGWLEARDNMLLDLDMIDQVVDMMDDYPEADYIINKIVRRLDNDKRY
jgi:hypothetical protein